MQRVILLHYCIVGHIAILRAAHAGCACSTSCASSAIHKQLRSKQYLGGGECVKLQLRALVVCMCMLLLLLELVLLVLYCL